MVFSSVSNLSGFGLPDGIIAQIGEAARRERKKSAPGGLSPFGLRLTADAEFGMIDANNAQCA